MRPRRALNPLRARFAATLVASVLLVVGAATLATVAVVHEAGQAGMARSVALQAGTALRAATVDPTVPTRAAPPAGRPDAAFAAALRDALADGGVRRPVVVVRGDRPDGDMAGVEAAPGRWVTVPVPPEGPPPGVWHAMEAWLAAVLAGTVAIAVLASARLTRPLALLDAVARDVGPDGIMARVPETGPAEVRAAARSLNRMGEALRSAMDSRMRLVAAAGHDMRTPITRMRLRAEFLDPGEQGRWLEDLAELERIADSAIDLVREEAGLSDAEPVDLAELAAGVAADLRAGGLPVEVGPMARTMVAAPRLALTRAVRNLASNAATHGGGATVRTAMDGDEAVLLVTDAGPGIPEHLIPRVFEPFFRADPARRQAVKGAGLGLAIAHGILTRAGGTLSLSNLPDRGLRQEARLPSTARCTAATRGNNIQQLSRGFPARVPVSRLDGASGARTKEPR